MQEEKYSNKEKKIQKNKNKTTKQNTSNFKPPDVAKKNPNKQNQQTNKQKSVTKKTQQEVALGFPKSLFGQFQIILQYGQICSMLNSGVYVLYGNLEGNDQNLSVITNMSHKNNQIGIPCDNFSKFSLQNLRKR